MSEQETWAAVGRSIAGFGERMRASAIALDARAAIVGVFASGERWQASASYPHAWAAGVLAYREERRKASASRFNPWTPIGTSMSSPLGEHRNVTVSRVDAWAGGFIGNDKRLQAWEIDNYLDAYGQDLISIGEHRRLK